ncbi:hypothetical protein [Paraburkholderia fungorum]|uniref:Sugar phosphate isomerase/epimerase n=1 Tax=Paraburkholderia fungorum TaxID=134537 RepID=A0AAW3USE6_9BURK|nr:hypothetical protein [Paraburkholderia fungorum]MBB4513019.1 sugar phosphate isomerase/epimerase [Paraburkholderia fungorum]MBB6201553.1 sugar phosphate isomerase/epimerase [Paraburkholderia fungorum]
MSETKKGDSPTAGVVTGQQLAHLFDAVRKLGTADGCEAAYGDVLKDLKIALSEAEAELEPTPDNPVIPSTIIVLGKLVRRLEPAPKHYAEKAVERTERLIDLCRRIGLVKVDHKGSLASHYHMRNATGRTPTRKTRGCNQAVKTDGYPQSNSVF